MISYKKDFFYSFLEKYFRFKVEVKVKVEVEVEVVEVEIEVEVEVVEVEIEVEVEVLEVVTDVEPAGYQRYSVQSSQPWLLKERLLIEKKEV